LPESATELFDEAALVARCRLKDAAAWKALYQRHFQLVFRTARSLGMESTEVEDVVQEVFTTAYRRLDRFSSGAFTTWLYRICANAVTDRMRRQKIRRAFAALLPKEEEAAPASASPEAQAARGEARHKVAEILSRMSPKKREVFAL